MKRCVDWASPVPPFMTFIIFCRIFTTHDIVSMLEDENVAANIFIEPNDGGVTDEDSGDEDGGGFLNNLSKINSTLRLNSSFLARDLVHSKKLLDHSKIPTVQIHNQTTPTAPHIHKLLDHSKIPTISISIYNGMVRLHNYQGLRVKSVDGLLMMLVTMVISITSSKFRNEGDVLESFVPSDLLCSAVNVT